MKKSTCLVFDPYLFRLGGGERYLYTAAGYARRRYEVTIASPELPSEDDLKRWGLDASIPRVRLSGEEFTLASANYDLAIVLINDFPPASRAKRSLLMLQFPFIPLAKRNPLKRLRQENVLRSYSIIVNSQFVLSWIKRRWQHTATVIEPPIELGTYDAKLKRPQILAVGRFFTGGHGKRQDAMIEAYRQLPDKTQQQWPLVLAGGCSDDEEGQTYLAQLKEQAKGLNIRFAINLTQAEIADLYRTSSLFWHATGYERPADQPERAEHFGMTTVEAMSYGVVPLVYADGGQVEIVTPEVGITWQTLEELTSETQALINRDSLDDLIQHAVAAAKRYDRSAFETKLSALL